MPNMANLSLKNNAGTTVTATQLSASAGDGVPARWRVELNTVPPAYRPLVEVTSRYSKFGSGKANKNVRRVDLKIVVPHYKVDAGKYSPDGQSLFEAHAVIPQTVLSSDTDDAVAYFMSVFADTLMASVFKTQISPT
ncbi:TPA_asm: coat protein [ssRNA phage SRR6960799_24]|uniref:Coat protein n=1 Tax=ssRNA phage SRR6960799_24 TaxID=2786581 RepID=A0A8S5L054_9VIRU|nr:coat protein [ssRNA phage SRR6960799_24]DAD50709.1 TPA_asm: coat protein [ssRNA phage SRR6960799_24]